MKIAIIGSRGIPARYGGFETFAEEISVLLVKEGFHVTVQCDPADKSPDMYNGVNLYHTSKSKTECTMRYYIEGLWWGLKNADIIIVTGVGAAVFYFLKILKKRTIITITDGIEYRRSKWSYLKKKFLRISEYIAVKLSDVVIADSNAIMRYLINKYKVNPSKIAIIEYGANINSDADISFLRKHNLVPFGFYLTVCRLEPENNIHTILMGHRLSGTKLPVVVVGPVLNNDYVLKLTREFSSGSVVFAGGIYEKEELKALRFFCKAYIHGHTVGGTNPSLLEAMASRNIVICHENEYNIEVTSGNQIYFKDNQGCSEAIRRVDSMTGEETDLLRQNSVNRILEYYTWDLMISKYHKLLTSIPANRI